MLIQNALSVKISHKIKRLLNKVAV